MDNSTFYYLLISESDRRGIDEAGTFGDWPEYFSEVDLQEESRYLDAAELKLMNESN